MIIAVGLRLMCMRYVQNTNQSFSFFYWGRRLHRRRGEKLSAIVPTVNAGTLPNSLLSVSLRLPSRGGRRVECSKVIRCVIPRGSGASEEVRLGVVLEHH